MLHKIGFLAPLLLISKVTHQLSCIRMLFLSRNRLLVSFYPYLIFLYFLLLFILIKSLFNIVSFLFSQIRTSLIANQILLNRNLISLSLRRLFPYSETFYRLVVHINNVMTAFSIIPLLHLVLNTHGSSSYWLLFALDNNF